MLRGARGPPVDYVDKLPSSPWWIFTPPKWRIMTRPLTRAIQLHLAAVEIELAERAGKWPRRLALYPCVARKACLIALHDFLALADEARRKLA